MNPNMFNMLAEPNRLQIVELLSNGPRPVNEIVNRLGLNQPQVSKHLKVLSDGGIVDVTPIKQQRIYGLKPEPFKELESWLEKYKYMWDKRLDINSVILSVAKDLYL